jgi:hypothetical protein
MTESIRAVRAVVQIGSLTVDGFMLPDGSYRMSQTQAAECVGLKVQNVSDFLRSKAFKALAGEGYTPQISEIEPAEEQLRGQARINALPLAVVRKYWLWQTHRGNKQALALVDALMAETLERRFDEAFGVTRTETERNELLNQRVQELEQDIREAFWVEDEIRIEHDHYERLLRENGIDPWGIPGAGDESG